MVKLRMKLVEIEVSFKSLEAIALSIKLLMMLTTALLHL